MQTSLGELDRGYRFAAQQCRSAFSVRAAGSCGSADADLRVKPAAAAVAQRKLLRFWSAGCTCACRSCWFNICPAIVPRLMLEISAVERTMGYPETELTSCRVGTSTAGQKRGKIANSATRSGSVEKSACILGSFGFCYGHPETERNRRIDRR
jgi:hypothetical protein